MTSAELIIFLLLLLSVFLVIFRHGTVAKFASYLRIFSALAAIWYYGYSFYTKSSEKLVKDALSVQIINSLPQPLDFYTIDRSGDKTLNVKHLEIIRPDFYRTFYDTFRAPHQMWIAGFLGKKNMVYFSEVPVKNLSEDKIIKVENYAVQDKIKSDTAAAEIENFRMDGVSVAVYITLTFLLLFINCFIIFTGLKK